ncbi:MAG: ATP-binding protein, partial [Kangiellaceae bacterium]|nr:ATP-binding protein [Kangiellaceae bacterium]
MLANDFEQDYQLEQLLTNNSKPKIELALNKLGVNEFQIISTKNETLLQNGTVSTPIISELVAEIEPIGYLIVDAKYEAVISGVSCFINEILQTNWRYQMASSLHLQVSKDDFESLQEKNLKLKESEAKYKSLSETLEIRVKEQVKIIEDSQRQLYETEKQASIGQLAAGVAHEINNPIGFISSNLNTAFEYLEELNEDIFHLIDNRDAKLDTEELKYVLNDFHCLLQESKEGAKRVAAIVADLKSFSNVEQAEIQQVNLNNNIALVCRVFKTSINAEIEINANTNSISKTYCKPAHINQMLLNLLQNGAEAILEKGQQKAGGILEITSEMEESYIVISIIDNGLGMDNEVLANVFTPFYTTREVGSGIGLGLTVCRDVVRAHNGKIKIESQPGEGTRVKIILPVKLSEND